MGRGWDSSTQSSGWLLVSVGTHLAFSDLAFSLLLSGVPLLAGEGAIVLGKQGQLLTYQAADQNQPGFQLRGASEAIDYLTSAYRYGVVEIVTWSALWEPRSPPFSSYLPEFSPLPHCPCSGSVSPKAHLPVAFFFFP